MNAVKENIINIDGSKLKTLLESATGKTLKEISLENGFSDSFLRMVVKTGKASPTAQAVIKLYGIEPSAYEVKPETPETEANTSDDVRQLTIDDLLEPDAKALLKALIKEAILETINECACQEPTTFYDPKTQTHSVYLKVKRESLKTSKHKSVEPDTLKAYEI